MCCVGHERMRIWHFGLFMNGLVAFNLSMSLNANVLMMVMNV